MASDAGLLDRLEAYYDAAPRPSARTEEVGPFTLFAATDPDGWPFYARPRLGLVAPVRAADVRGVTDRQRELGVPRTLEWVHQTTPSLLAAAQHAGLRVRESPLLVLSGLPPRPSARVRVLTADDPDLAMVLGAVSAGFAGSDEVSPREPGRVAAQLAAGLLVVAGAYGDRGEVVGGGSHGPRGDVTEVTGIAVVPRARRRGLGAELAAALARDAAARGIGTVFLSAQNDSVARVYERVGFVQVGTACVAELVEQDPG